MFGQSDKKSFAEALHASAKSAFAYANSLGNVRATASLWTGILIYAIFRRLLDLVSRAAVAVVRSEQSCHRRREKSFDVSHQRCRGEEREQLREEGRFITIKWLKTHKAFNQLL